MRMLRKIRIGIRRRRGSAVVMLTALFLSMVMIFSVITEAAFRYAAWNTSDAAMQNAGRNLLSCYDKALYERYGIFAFEMDEEGSEKNIRAMLKASLEESPAKRLTLEELYAESAAYSLLEPENLKEQLVKLMKYQAVEDVINAGKEKLQKTKNSFDEKDHFSSNVENQERAMDAAEEAQNQRSSEDSSDEETVDFASIRQCHRSLKNTKNQAESITPKDEENNRVLRNEKIIDALPSKTYRESVSSGYDGSGSFSFSEISESAGDELLLTEYICDYFSDHLDTPEDSFFQNEVEYILYGELSDRTNYTKAYAAIFAIREAMNLAYLMTDTVKKEEALAMATALTPGPWEVLTQFLILAAWAAAESYNDIKNLESGNGVPLMKTNSTWMITLSSVIEGSLSEEGIMIPGNSEMDYQSYLCILLMTTGEETKLLRMMDLIQINLKGTERSDFIIADHYTGVNMTASVKKKSCSPFIGDSSFELTQMHSYYSEKIKKYNNGDAS